MPTGLRQRIMKSLMDKQGLSRKKNNQDKLHLDIEDGREDISDWEFSVTSSCMGSENSFSMDSPSPKGRRGSCVRFDTSPSVHSCTNSVEPSPRSCLKKYSINLEEAAKLAIQEREKERFLQKLKDGAIMKKIYANSDKLNKFFYVTEDGTELKYASLDQSGTKKSESRITIAAIRGIRFGIGKFSESYDWRNGMPENCFSIILSRDRRIDVECSSREMFFTWFIGLQLLSPMSHRHISRGKLNWKRAQYQSIQMAKKRQISEKKLWMELITNAKAEYCFQ